ncbi:hypothetical protein ACWCV9_27220 [Streptomyces sp. NPDC001606]
MTRRDAHDRCWVRAVVAGAALLAVLTGAAATAAHQSGTHSAVAWNSTGSDYDPPKQVM